MKRLWLAAALLAAPALAKDEPRFCPNRPTLGTSTCTTEPDRVLVEMSGIDWTRDDRPGAREDTLLFGDLLTRTGLGANTELQLSWTPFGQVRTRDKATGAVTTERGVGDVRLGVRQLLMGPNGEGDGIALAIEPFVTLPVGRTPIGDTAWSAGVVLPVTYDLSDDWALGFTGEATAVPGDAGRGHHLALGGTLGIGRKLSDRVSAVGELSVRHEDSASAALVTAFSIAWQPRSRLQLDALAVAGLNRAAPDFQLQIGGAVLF